MTGLLFTLIWFPLLGAAVSRLVGRMNWFLAGAGVNGLVLFVASVLRVPLVPVLIVLGLAAIAALVRPAKAGRYVDNDNNDNVGAGFSPPADIVLALAIALLLAISAIKPLDDYDGRAFWLLKAKAIAHEGTVDGPFFHGETSFSPRNEYPLLVPLDAATILLAARDLDDRHVRWLYALFAVALALEVRRRAGPWLGALVLWLPQIAFSALTAYSDLALAAFVACAVFELASSEPSAWRAGLWLSFIVLTKNEGLPFAFVLLAVSLFVLRRIATAIPMGVAVAVLFLWRSRIDPTDEARYSLDAASFERFGDAVEAFARHVVAFADWGVFWLAAAVAAALLAWRRQWRPLAIACATIAPMLAIYLIMYAVSNWKTEDLVNSTAPRLLTHFLGPAMLLLGHADHKDD